MTTQERVRRLADFDLAGLGGVIWNRLLEGGEDVRDAVDRWEEAIGRKNIQWFSEEGARFAGELEQSQRVRFRKVQMEIRQDAFSVFADAVGRPINRYVIARFEPIIRGYGAAVVRNLRERKRRTKVRKAVESVREEAASGLMVGSPILRTNFRYRLNALLDESRTNSTLEQVARCRELMSDAMTLRQRREALKKQRNELQRTLARTASDKGPSGENSGYESNVPPTHQVRSLRRALRSEEYSTERMRCDREVLSLRRRLKREFGGENNNASNPIMGELITTLRSP